MSQRIKKMVLAVRGALARGVGKAGSAARAGARAVPRPGLRLVLATAVIGGLAWLTLANPPLRKIERGNIGIRINQLTGAATTVNDGAVFVLPGVHTLRQLPRLDQLYKPAANGESPYQSVEGLAMGVDLTVRYAFDPARIVSVAQTLPDNITTAVIEPAVQGVIYKIITRYTVREIFSTKRAEIQQTIEAELKPKLASDGIVLRGVTIGKVDAARPTTWRGMEKLLAEELETRKNALHAGAEGKTGQADCASRPMPTRSSARRRPRRPATSRSSRRSAQEEAMKHVLPFKQKQIEQRRLEAEAEKASRIKTSEGAAEARRIEAAGEADSRRKLADAEAYRQEVVGKWPRVQMERDGAVITRHPLLIQKTLADKLSDKVSGDHRAATG